MSSTNMSYIGAVLKCILHGTTINTVVGIRKPYDTLQSIIIILIVFRVIIIIIKDFRRKSHPADIILKSSIVKLYIIRIHTESLKSFIFFNFNLLIPKAHVLLTRRNCVLIGQHIVEEYTSGTNHKPDRFKLIVRQILRNVITLDRGKTMYEEPGL